MDYCKSIQETIDEIEAHLKDEINCDAKIIHDESQRTLKDTYQIFYGLWLPNSGLELAQQDTIEVYYLNENKMEIWIPVISN